MGIVVYVIMYAYLKLFLQFIRNMCSVYLNVDDVMGMSSSQSDVNECL